MSTCQFIILARPSTAGCTNIELPTSDKLSAVSIGGGLTAAQAIALSRRINGFMAALSISVYSSNALAFSGPSTGVAGTASTNFTVALTGQFNGTQTVTLADGTGSGGGMFTPSVGSSATSSVVVTPTAGTSNFTFTYNAATTGAFTLAFSNSLGLAENPTSLPYMASSASADSPYVPVGFTKTFSDDFTESEHHRHASS